MEIPITDSEGGRCACNALMHQHLFAAADVPWSLSRQINIMRDLFQSLNHAFRGLRKNPGFTLPALAVLTLGIGANTAIFSVVNTVLLRPLPFPDSHAIVTVFHTPPATAFPGVKTFSVSPANYLDWRKQNDVFESMTVFSGRSLPIGGGERPQQLIAT